MHNKLLSHSFLTWFLFIPLAIGNGIARNLIYTSYVGELIAHQISTAIASIAFIALAYFMIRKDVVEARNTALFSIGLLWVCMTVLFEFGFGHYISGASWEKLLNDYNLFQGHVWGIFLLALLFTPYLIKILREKRR